MEVARRPVVLVVEHDDATVDSAAAILVLHEFLVLRADTAPNAMELIARRERVDVLFTDLDLIGKADGFRLALFARRTWPDIGVIYAFGDLDGLAADRDLPRAARLKVKPYSAEDPLGEVVRLVLDRSARMPRPIGHGEDR